MTKEQLEKAQKITSHITSLEEAIEEVATQSGFLKRAQTVPCTFSSLFITDTLKIPFPLFEKNISDKIFAMLIKSFEDKKKQLEKEFEEL